MKGEIIELVIDLSGTTSCIYTDDLDLARPDEHGQWWADLSPIAGPKLGPFTKRNDALDAEVAWLRRHWLGRSPARDLQ